MKEINLDTILTSAEATKEAKYIVYGGKLNAPMSRNAALLALTKSLLLQAIRYLQTNGWSPMHRKAADGRRDIEGALEAADGDQYPKTSAQFRLVVAAIMRHLDYEAIHMWEYNGGSYRTSEEVLLMLLRVVAEE